MFTTKRDIMRLLIILSILLITIPSIAQTVTESVGSYKDGKEYLNYKQNHEGNMSWQCSSDTVKWIVSNTDDIYLLNRTYTVNSLNVVDNVYTFVVTNTEDQKQLTIELTNLGDLWSVKHYYAESFVIYRGAIEVTIKD